MLSTERRTSERVDLSSDALVTLGGEIIPCRTINVAEKGILLSTPVRRRVGCPVDIEFRLPGEMGWIFTRATLVRDARRYGSFVWGIEFEALEQPASSTLSEFLRENLPS